MLFPNWQKESWQTFEETSGYVRPERVNKWPNSITDDENLGFKIPMEDSHFRVNHSLLCVVTLVKHPHAFFVTRC